MKRYFQFILLMLLTACVSQVPAQTSRQVSISTNTFKFVPGASTNTLRSNVVAGALISISFDSLGGMTIASTGGTGSVSSVGLTVPSSILTLNNSPITSSGDIEILLQNQDANKVWAGPTTGAAANPTFRLLVAGDIPDLSGTYQVAGSYQPASANLTNWSGTATNEVIRGVTNAGNSSFSLLSTSNAPTVSLKSLSAGANVTLTDEGTNIVIGSTGGGSGLTNTFNSGQFTLVNGTNVNLKTALTITNPFVNLSSLSYFTLSNGAAVANERAWGVLSTGGTDFTIKGLDDVGAAGTGGIILQRVDENVTTAEITANNSVTLNAAKVYLIGPSTNGVLFLRPDGILTNAALSGLVYTNGVLSNSVAGSSGDVTGPASSTDNTIPRFDGTGGKTLQGSGVAIDDSDNVDVPGTLTANGATIAGLNPLRLHDGADYWKFTPNTPLVGLSMDYGSLNVLYFTTNALIPGTSPMDFDLGSVTVPFRAGYFTNLSAEGGITNLSLTASRMVYSDANKVLTSASFGPSQVEPWANSNTNMLRTVTNNFSVKLDTGDTDEIDMSLASSTNVLAGALTIAHATNGISGYERTHVRWLWAGGSDRALTIPSGWKTNVYSAVPANITNGTITKMYVTTIGDTSTSANQTNVFVSFEFYK